MRKVFYDYQVPRKKEITCIVCGIQKMQWATATSSFKYCSNKCQMVEKTKTTALSGKASSRSLRKFLLNENGNNCWSCGIDSWMNQPITLELDHINGKPEDNRIENLRLLCPNCHSQTETYKSKNRGNGRQSRRQRYAEGKSF